jgi:hypothetical protein
MQNLKVGKNLGVFLGFFSKPLAIRRKIVYNIMDYEFFPRQEIYT